MKRVVNPSVIRPGWQRQNKQRDAGPNSQWSGRWSAGDSAPGQQRHPIDSMFSGGGDDGGEKAAGRRRTPKRFTMTSGATPFRHPR